MVLRRGLAIFLGTYAIILLAAVIAVISFLFWPESLPQGERQKIEEAISGHDVAIIFNPGGWGNASLDDATDFAPILKNIQSILTAKGYSSVIVPYARTAPGFSGTITGIREYIISFPATARFQARDIESLMLTYPTHYFILAGYSNGGALTARVMRNLDDQSRVFSISVGVPGWYLTENTSSSLVLNNAGKDPVATSNIQTIAYNVLKAPYRWIEGKMAGRKITLGTAFHFPGHEYTWDMPEVGAAVAEFLDRNFPVKTGD